MLPLEAQADDAARREAFDRDNAEQRRELLRLMERSPHRQSAKARTLGRSLTPQTDVDGLALFDAHRSPELF